MLVLRVEGIVEEIGASHELGGTGESRHPRPEADGAVGAGKDAEGEILGVGVPLHEGAGVLVVEHEDAAPVLTGRLGLEDGDVHVVAVAGELLAEEGGTGGEGRHLSRLVEADRAAELDGGPVGRAGRLKLAAHAVLDELVGEEVAVRPRLPEVGDGDHNDAGVAFREGVVVESQLLHDARLEVLHDNIGAFGEIEGEALPLGVGKIEGDAALAGVEVEEEAAPLGVRFAAGERAHPAGAVPRCGGAPL